MFDVPSDDDIARVVVSRETVLGNVLPTIVRQAEITRHASAPHQSAPSDTAYGSQPARGAADPGWMRV